MAAPVLIYDGDCGFCTSSVRFIERWVRTSARITPWQLEDLEALGTTTGRAAYELLWVEPGGRVYGGAQGVAKLLIDAGFPWAPLGWAARIPPFRWIAHALYRLTANYRHRLPGGTPACSLPSDQRPGARPGHSGDDLI